MFACKANHATANWLDAASADNTKSILSTVLRAVNAHRKLLHINWAR